jgi:hypothetical protein
MAGLRAIASPSAGRGSGLDATRPRPGSGATLTPAFDTHREAVSVPSPGRVGAAELPCGSRRDESPAPLFLKEQWLPLVAKTQSGFSERLAAGRLRERLGEPSTLLGKTEQCPTPRRGFGQTIDAEIKVRMGKSPNVFDDKLQQLLVHGGDGPVLCSKESRYP